MNATLTAVPPLLDLLADAYPLPSWPAHLPEPVAEYGISEEGSAAPDLWLHTGDRTVHLISTRDPQGHFCNDIDDDPGWAHEDLATRAAVVAYGSVLLARYLEGVAAVWSSAEGRALLARVHTQLRDAC